MDDVGPIIDEMNDRLEGELSEKDRRAVGAAIAKALIWGANRGIADATAQVRRQLPGAKITIEPAADPPDLWTEHYGADA